MSADLTSHNVNVNIIDVIPEFMEESSLVDIEREFRDCPQGHYGGRLGSLNSDNASIVFRTYGPKFSKEYDMTSEEYDKLIEDFVKELDTYKSHNRTLRFWGKKI